MERQVKERLIGAAVLVAIAVILIPELLSGPTAKHKPSVATAPDKQTIKTYQFDLNQPGAASGQFTSSTAAPPAEQTPAEQPESKSASSAEVASAPPAETPASAAAPVQAPPAESPPESVASTKSAEKKPPEPPARAPASNASGWAVQLGSFADAERANHLLERLRAAGHNAYLVPLRRANGKTLQRVRIGPYSERSTAEQVLQRVAGEAKGAAVVPQS